MARPLPMVGGPCAARSRRDSVQAPPAPRALRLEGNSEQLPGVGLSSESLLRGSCSRYRTASWAVCDTFTKASASPCGREVHRDLGPFAVRVAKPTLKSSCTAAGPRAGLFVGGRRTHLDGVAGVAAEHDPLAPQQSPAHHSVLDGWGPEEQSRRVRRGRPPCQRLVEGSAGRPLEAGTGSFVTAISTTSSATESHGQVPRGSDQMRRVSSGTRGIAVPGFGRLRVEDRLKPLEDQSGFRCPTHLFVVIPEVRERQILIRSNWNVAVCRVEPPALGRKSSSSSPSSFESSASAGPERAGCNRRPEGPNHDLQERSPNPPWVASPRR